MKKSSQFFPLLKQMLGFYRYGPLPLFFWFLSCGIVLGFGALISPVEWMSDHNRSDFMDGQFGSLIMFWGFLMMVSTPLPFQILDGLSSLEFLFTRAMDRSIWLRTQRVAVIIIALGPVILNLLVWPWQPPMAFDVAAPGTRTAQMQERYMKIFSGSHVVAGDAQKGAVQLIVPQGNTMFALWLVWAGLMIIFLVSAYFSIAYTAWQKAGWHHSKSKHRTWLGVVMTQAPIFLPMIIILCCVPLRLNIFEEVFLLFAAHPLWLTLILILLIAMVQPMTERNIQKLEFEFA